jgi:hypothetical protein
VLPLAPLVDDRVPTFMAEDNATLLAIAGQVARRDRGRRQAAAVLRWRAVTSVKGGRTGRPTSAQLAELDRLDPGW